MSSQPESTLTIEQVDLAVRDLERTRRFYENVLGLHAVNEGAGWLSLGAGGHGFLRLLAKPHADLPGPHRAGLFHTAFLMSSRVELARWLRYAIDAGIRLEGASDHRVSEAVYLRDPEGQWRGNLRGLAARKLALAK